MKMFTSGLYRCGGLCGLHLHLLLSSFHGSPIQAGHVSFTKVEATLGTQAVSLMLVYFNKI
jgi:hypothetical protein